MSDTTPVGRRHRSVLLPLSSERARRPFRSPFRSPDGAAVTAATTNTTTPPPPAASRRPPAKQLLLHQPSTPPPAATAAGGGGCSTPVNRNRSCRLSAGTTGAPSIAAVAPQLPPGQKHSLPVMTGDGGVIGRHTPLSSGAEDYRTPPAAATVTTTTTTTTTKTVSTAMSLSKSAAVGDGSRGGDCSLEQQQWAPVGGTCDGDRAKTTAAVFRPPTALSTPSATSRSGGGGGGGVCGGGGDRVAVVVAALDAEIGELEAEGCCVNQLLLYRTALHRYNVVKDAAQVVMGRLAELDGVTVRAVHERFDTLPSTELL